VAANVFAAQHISLTGDLNDPRTLTAYTAAQNALAAVYDLATSNPGVTMVMPQGQTTTAGALLAGLGATTIVIGPSPGPYPQFGAYTEPYSATNYVIYIDPNSAPVVNSEDSWGAAGANYVIFHELGHVFGGGTSDEALANSIGRDLALVVGVPYPTDAQLALPPNFGTYPN
jgi:hypothetical protein